MMKMTTYNNVTIPAFMYGTAWKKGKTAPLVQSAVSLGFKAIDTANQPVHYQEALVGEALLALSEQGVHRETLFLQTKFTPVGGQDHRIPYDPSAELTLQVQQSFESSLTHLHTDYLDSYILHGPYSRIGLGREDWEVWKALEGLYQSGRAKMIGISNVNAGQLQELCEHATVKPMVVQNRCYAVLGWDQDVRKICQTHHILYQGFSLLTANRNVMSEPEIWEMAKSLGATPPQIIFRFALQIGMLPLTGTTSRQHMEEDLHVLDAFELSQGEMSRLEHIAVSAEGS